MSDWKGQKVQVMAYRLPEKPITREVYLDTDTMADLFEEFPPQDGWRFIIRLAIP